jgi:hypothetical protein
MGRPLSVKGVSALSISHSRDRSRLSPLGAPRCPDESLWLVVREDERQLTTVSTWNIAELWPVQFGSREQYGTGGLYKAGV